MSDTTVTFNSKPLQQIVKALRGKPPVVRIGIFGAKDSRSSGKLTNAEIGAKHEYGLDGMPQRSFLRIPLMERLPGAMENARAFDRPALAEIVRSGSILVWMKKMAIIAEDVVAGAFDSGGYGKWPAWKNPHYQNNTGKILVDTQQLRNSITTEVK